MLQSPDDFRKFARVVSTADGTPPGDAATTAVAVNKPPDACVDPEIPLSPQALPPAPAATQPPEMFDTHVDVDFDNECVSVILPAGVFRYDEESAWKFANAIKHAASRLRQRREARERAARNGAP